MKRFASGLVVGKFAPLHCGHERLINAALAQCERVWLISYSQPELPGCEPDKREHWLQARFPQCGVVVLTPERVTSWGLGALPHNDAPDSLHRHYMADLCLQVLRCRPQAVFTAEAYGEGFAQVLSERFAQPVTHVRLQREQGAHAPSGTLIRGDVHRWRQMLSPVVYRDFVKRICLLGGESTGKSTLSAALAQALGTAFVAEYGRERWEEKGGELAYDDMLPIAQTQVAREDNADAVRWLVCDTSPLTTLFYTLEMFGKAPDALFTLAQRSYHLVVLCEDDFPFVQDGTRQDETFRQRQQAWYVEQLTQRGVPFMRVRGSVSQRVAQILAVAGS
ncbi:AAA family ATPase [Kosakonia sp. BK9b]|uniref:AAA family ATPase n=1 Tax=Kosakonia sp. TaxID=1916651 RepID=UPI00289BA3BB|nr:AAA family ATPase [Kosakonia sp.]